MDALRLGSVRHLTAAVGLCAALTATAQETTPSSSPAAEINEIIVTARRVEEREQDVPISMTVFNQEQLLNRNVVNAGDIARYTPSLAANSRFGSENTSFAIRGFIQEGPTSPSVAVYFADVVAPRGNGGTTGGNGAGPGSFFDLQNVQVLKGPQGTLFGRNTTGGAVLLVPQKPTSETEGYLEVSGGSYEMRRVEAAFNAPLGEKFRARLSADFQSRDGYLRNISYVPNTPRVGPEDFGDVNYYALRLSAVWDVTPNIENYTIGSYSKSNTNGFAPKMVLALPTTNNTPTYRYTNYAAQVAALSGDFYDVSNGNPYAHQIIKQWQVINTTAWTATDTITLKNIISYTDFRESQAASIYGDDGVTAGSPLHYNYAVATLPAPGKYNISQSTFTEELQLQHRPTDRLNYQAGLYYETAQPLNGFQETYAPIFLDCIDVLSFQCTDTRGRNTVIAPGVTLEGRIGALTNSRTEYHFHNRGVYAQGTYKLTDQWSLTGGIRYTSDDTAGLGQVLKLTFPAANTPNFTCANPNGVVQGGSSAQILADPTRCNLYRNVSSSKPTWMVDLDYKPIDDMLLYAKYARGYRQGSVNVSSYGLETWGPEKVDTYEIGTKNSFHSLVSGIVNVAVFYNDFTNQQLQLGTVSCTTADLANNPAQCPFIGTPAAGIANAGKSTIKGVEFETSLNLFQGFNFDVGYSYLDTKIKEITLGTPPLGFRALTTAPAGGRIPLTPKHKYSATASYTLPLPDSIGRITLAATHTYQTRMDGSVSSIASGLYTLPIQKQLNVNLNWSSIANIPLNLSLFATNLTQEKYYVFTTGASFGFDSAVLNEPRMFGARLKYRFGG